MFTTIWVSREAVSLASICINSSAMFTLLLNFCEILMVILFSIAGFPRKQTGKNLYFFLFCYKEDVIYDI